MENSAQASMQKSLVNVAKTEKISEVNMEQKRAHQKEISRAVGN